MIHLTYSAVCVDVPVFCYLTKPEVWIGELLEDCGVMELILQSVFREFVQSVLGGLGFIEGVN